MLEPYKLHGQCAEQVLKHALNMYGNAHMNGLTVLLQLTSPGSPELGDSSISVIIYGQSPGELIQRGESE